MVICFGLKSTNQAPRSSKIVELKFSNRQLILASINLFRGRWIFHFSSLIKISFFKLNKEKPKTK